MKPGVKKAIGWTAGIAFVGLVSYFLLRGKKVTDLSQIQWIDGPTGKPIDPSRWYPKQNQDGSVALYNGSGELQTYTTGTLDNQGILWQYAGRPDLTAYWYFPK